MKKFPPVRKKLIYSSSADAFFTPCLAVMFALLILSSCSSNDDDQTPSFFGSYAVEDSRTNGYTYTYDISVSDATNGDLNLSNFADLLKVPVKAKLDGTKLTINSQTFHGQNNMTIEVSGSGTLIGDELQFTYMSTGALTYTGTCVARKK